MPNANPQLVKWLQDLRDNEDSEGNLYKTYNKALTHLKKHPTTFSHPRESIVVHGVGQKIVGLLTKRWEATQRGEEYHEPPPRGRKNKSFLDQPGPSSYDMFDDFLAPGRPAAAPKKRGRPPKRKEPEPDSDSDSSPPPPKRHNSSLNIGLNGNGVNLPAVAGPSVPPFYYLDTSNNRVSQYTEAAVEIIAPFILYKAEVPLSPPPGKEFRQCGLGAVDEWRRPWSRVAWIEENDIERLQLWQCAGFLDPASIPATDAKAAKPQPPRVPLSAQSSMREQADRVPNSSQPVNSSAKENLASLLAQESRNKIRTLDPSRTNRSRTEATGLQDGLAGRSQLTTLHDEHEPEPQDGPDFPSDPLVARKAAAAAALRRQQQAAQPAAAMTDPKGKGKAREQTYVPSRMTFEEQLPPGLHSNAGPSRTSSMPAVPQQSSSSGSSFLAPSHPTLSRTASAPAGPSRRPAPRMSTHVPRPAAVDEHDQDYSPALDTLQSFPRFVPHTLPARSFEIFLILDNREVKSQRHRDFIRDGLIKKGVKVEQRALAVGDACWIAKAFDGTECVLDYILERKRMDDLVASIKDPRYEEQKFRLRQSGITHVQYLVESYNDEKHQTEMNLAINTALSQTQVGDGFYLKETRHVNDTIDHLSVMHETICAMHRNADLHIIPSHLIKRHSYLALQRHLRETQPSTTFLTTYEDHKELNAKSAHLTINGSWARMLLCIKGCSPEKVSGLIEEYATPRQLWQAFQVAQQIEDEGLDKERREGLPQVEKGKRKAKSAVPLAKAMLTEVGGTGRKKIGAALSEKIYEVIMAMEYEP